MVRFCLLVQPESQEAAEALQRLKAAWNSSARVLFGDRDEDPANEERYQRQEQPEGQPAEPATQETQKKTSANARSALQRYPAGQQASVKKSVAKSTSHKRLRFSQEGFS